jgi:hypothetical protein
MKSLDHLAGSGLYAVAKTAGNWAPFAMIPNVNNRLILVAGERPPSPVGRINGH